MLRDSRGRVVRGRSQMRAVVEGLSLREVSLTGLGLLTGFLGGVFARPLFNLFSTVFGRRHDLISFDDDDDDNNNNSSNSHQPLFTQALNSREESKLVFCVRTDLKMQKGKIAAQVGHATLGAYKAALRINPAAVKRWEVNAQPKIALQVRSQTEVNQLERNAKRKGLPTYKVFDAGRTQIAAVSSFAISLYPIRARCACHAVYGEGMHAERCDYKVFADAIMILRPISCTQSICTLPSTYALYLGEFNRPGDWTSSCI